jgi:hypothetical protein
MSDRTFILSAIDNDRDGLINGVKHLYNCCDADVDAAGDIWIEGPHRGHWLDADGIARVERALKEGLI